MVPVRSDSDPFFGNLRLDIADDAIRGDRAAAMPGFKWTEDADHEISPADSVAVARPDRLQIGRRIDQLEHGEVAPPVGSENIGIAAFLSGKPDVHLRGVLDDVKVRQDQAARIEHDAAAIRFGYRLRVGQVEAVDEFQPGWVADLRGPGGVKTAKRSFRAARQTLNSR